MMLTAACPKLPSRNLQQTKEYYCDLLGFSVLGEYPEYLLLQREDAEIHFFSYPDLDPSSNYGQCYFRVSGISSMYEAFISKGVQIHPNGALDRKLWGVIEFSLLDPDANLLTFGELVWYPIQLSSTFSHVNHFHTNTFF